MSSSDLARWSDPAWRVEAETWIRTAVGAVDGIEQIHLQPWSTVLRVATPSGDLFFKANAPQLRHEAALVELLARRRPDCVPPLLAVDAERGWMLMADAGEQLRAIVERDRELERWLDVLPLYASVQLDLADDVDALLALGVPDFRLATLPAAYERFLDGMPPAERRRFAVLLPQVAEMCDELAAYGLPETIQHDDFHDAQVYVRDGRYLLLDWGDACVSHPFFTLSVTLEGVIAWGLDDVENAVDVAPYRDAYLNRFAGRAAHDDLVAAAGIAMRLGWICRAVNGYVPGDSPEQTARRLEMF